MPRSKTLPDQDVLAAGLQAHARARPGSAHLRRRGAGLRPLGRDAGAAFQEQGRAQAAHLALRLGSAGREDREAGGHDCHDAGRSGGIPGRRCPRTMAGSKPTPRGCWCCARIFAIQCCGRAAPPGRKDLSGILDDCFAGVAHAPPGIGLLIASHWQGSLLWWAFDPQGDVDGFVEDSLRRFVAAVVRS